jgi:hypothetical protein
VRPAEENIDPKPEVWEGQREDFNKSRYACQIGLKLNRSKRIAIMAFPQLPF